ncbi:septin-9 [Perognathus longimembris pacificus]|uniref:septin-9 n=1 Tax=Perognathus longimembris pacificus TaxID=214514 RepID=UPI002018BF07|nr:septin-9 [Perognathus longimembris pacificus]
MSDPAVNAQLDGIISDFEALKRSFEVEEAEPPNATPPRRVQTPLLRATVAGSAHKFQDLGVKNSDPLSQRSPKAALRRGDLPGPKAPEPVSRRTELSIDISSKQVENAGAAGPSRFGLKRAEGLGHKTPEPTPRRTEITLVKPQEPALRRMEVPASKAPEVPPAPADAAPKRVEIQMPRPAEPPACPLPPQTPESSEPPTSQPQSRLEPKLAATEGLARSQEGEWTSRACLGPQGWAAPPPPGRLQASAREGARAPPPTPSLPPVPGSPGPAAGALEAELVRGAGLRTRPRWFALDTCKDLVIPPPPLPLHTACRDTGPGAQQGEHQCPSGTLGPESPPPEVTRHPTVPVARDPWAARASSQPRFL